MNNFINVSLFIRSIDPQNGDISFVLLKDKDTYTLPTQRLATMCSRENAIMLAQKYISVPMSWYNIVPFSFYDIDSNIYLVYLINTSINIAFKNGAKIYTYEELSKIDANKFHKLLPAVLSS